MYFREFQKLDEKVVANKWFLPLVWTSKMLVEGVDNGSIQVNKFISKYVWILQLYFNIRN